jgi:monoamine oxidase
MLRFPHAARLAPLGPAERLQRPKDLRLKNAACAKTLKGIGRVAVIGGGFAGLMAARQLVRQGIAVSLYEARPFVGGRVYSNRSFSNGRIIEEGAELIGSFHTRWLELAREFGLAMVSRMDSDLYQLEGLREQLILEDRPLSPAKLAELSDQMDKRVLVPLADVAKKLVDPARPWRQASLTHRGQTWPLTKLDDFSVQDALPNFCQIAKRGSNPGDELLWKIVEFKLVNDEVAPLDEMNFLGLLCKVRAGQGERMSTDLLPNAEAYWDELEIFRCADGCDALATKLAAAIQTKQYGSQPAKVSRLVAVTQIHMSKLGVTLGLKATNPDGTFKDDKPAFLLPGFSRVILAIPPSVWPRVQITVDKTSIDLAKEIGPMQMNEAVKHFSKMKERFWIKGKVAPYGGAMRLGQVWEGTDNQTRVGSQGIVMSVFAGPTSASKRAPTRDDCENWLPRLYPDTPGNPGYAGNLLKPTLFSDWPNKAFIKTGYWSPLPREIFKVSEKLTRPFHERLFFAGEHTQTDFFGYMEGALRSGERAADTLMLSACGLLEKDGAEPLRAAEVARESTYQVGPDEESFDENESPDGHEAVPVWNESDESWATEDEQRESFEDEDTPLPSAEVNSESAAPHADEFTDAPAFE